MAAGEAVRTITLVAGPVVDASGAVLVDAGGSGVEFLLATDDDEIRIARAVKTRAEIAGAAVEAGRDGRAFVDFVLTEGASQSWPWPSLAVILVDLVQASVRPYGIARIVQAYVNLALNAQKSWPAPALETFQGVAAGLAVVARLAPAVVDAVLALFAREAQGAEAAVVSLNVLALAAIEARIAGTFVHLDSTVGAHPVGLVEAQRAEEDVDAGAMSTLVSHLFPVNSAGQEQAKSSIKLVQLLPSKQGDSAQSSDIRRCCRRRPDIRDRSSAVAPLPARYPDISSV